MKYPLILLLTFMPTVLLSQYSIQGNFTPKGSYDMAMLYQVHPDYLDYKTHVEFDEDGQFTIPLDSTFTTGIYKLVYGLPQEIYNFDIIYNGTENIQLSFNADTGLSFKQSQENKLLMDYKKAMSKIGQDIGNAYSKPVVDSLDVMRIFEVQQQQQSKFETQSKGLLASNFIYANGRYIPKQFESLKTYISNVKSQYFDAVDFENDILKSSNFFIEHASNFLFGFNGSKDLTNELLSKNIKDLNQVLTQSAKDPTRYAIMLSMFDQLLEANYEPAALFTASNILKPLAQKLNDKVTLNEIIDFERTALGAKAPNFEIEVAATNSSSMTLHDLKDAKTYILIFWSSSCSHCIDDMPIIQNKATTIDKSVTKIIAVGLETDVYKWNDLKYTWTALTHVLAMGKWEHPLVELYNISATPHFLVLNADKTIIAKPQNIDELLPFLQK